MDFNRIKLQLKKITRTVDMIEADGQITKLEMDLLRDYIRKLYEYTNREVEQESQSSKSKGPAESSTPQSPGRSENGSSKEIEPDTDKGKNKEVATVSDSSKDLSADTEPSKSRTESIPQEILELFEEEEATELSEKLSKMAINDIEKSMSINEKIFTINELFDGNSQEFRACLSKLDQLNDYDRAVSYLSKDVAAKYEWADESKRKKALNFIQLVHRKFRS